MILSQVEPITEVFQSLSSLMVNFRPIYFLDTSTLSIITSPTSNPITNHPEGALFSGSNLGCSDYRTITNDPGQNYFVALTVDIFDSYLK